ncbi:MAG: DUF6438 domain-containing protein [Hyphomonas sp.]|uniref:DUF6438 domain-containing protein n=1 Tax=Hyphomonas sp. TaxID=87 RepID=UPI003001089E
MTQMKTIACVFTGMGLAAMLAACAPAETPAPAAEPATEVAAPAEAEMSAEPEAPAYAMPAGGPGIIFTVTPCYGTCPAYSVNLFDDGVLLFRRANRDTSDVDVIVREDAFATPEGFQELVNQLQSQGLADLNGNYTNTMTDGRCRTDASSKILEVRTAEFTKRVEFYTGCSEFADETKLQGLFGVVEEAIGAEALLAQSESPAAPQ